MYYLYKGYTVIQLPECLLSIFNYLNKKWKYHILYGSKACDSDITSLYNKTELNNAKTSKSTVTIKPTNAPMLHERVNSLESTVNNIESKLEEIINAMGLK